jgi:hypothetical protein
VPNNTVFTCNTSRSASGTNWISQATARLCNPAVGTGSLPRDRSSF